MGIGVETFLQPALQPVFDLIFSEGVKLFVTLTGGELDDTLVEWETELMMINVVLDDAVAKQFQSKPVQRWLAELQDLAFDMEDVLADFAIQAQEHEFNSNTEQQDDDDDGGGVINAINNMMMVASTTISDSMSTLNSIISPSIQSKIEGINKRLDRIRSRTQFLHLSKVNITQQQTLSTEALRSQRETSSLASESKVFGRDDLKQEIITRLLKDNDDLSNESYVVIPIVGNGGIGKTTLAQCVYNDEQLKGHFNLKAWVCVSDVFDVKRITTTIIKAATPSGTLVDEALTQLKQILMSKKFLIVLDDIWNCEYDDWFCLQAPFKHAAKGSRVIMTTRRKDIARMMIDRPMQDTIINLKGLSKDDCWNLFKQHANPNDSDLAEMQDDIIKKCKGLPLAAKALGGLFRKTVDKRRRQVILESNVWSEESGVLPVLRLSYDYLPSHSKRIFAYLSLFPKDYIFDKTEVILLWMAQGFLSNDEHMEMENTGHNYFNDLESRSLLEQCSNPRWFVMHDLIHDLALWAAGGICYGRGTKNMTGVDRERIRHVFLADNVTSLLSQLKASHLRTFYIDRMITNLEFIQSLSYVRTLRLVSKTIKVLPEGIGDLKHLRFLSLKFDIIEELPKSINNLWNLQTLWLEGCSNLKKVPYIGSLKKLRHLEIGRRLIEMPRGFEKLTNLKSLDYFILADGHGSRIKELKNLNHLQGQLTICGLENVSKVEDAQEAELHQKNGLDELCFKWGTHTKKRNNRHQVDYNTVRDVVEQLKPATSIKECKLDGYMGLILPAWLGDPSFSNIVTIKLWRCKKCEELPPLGKLPCLKILHIEYMDSIKRVGVEFYGCSNPFPALESLFFNRLMCWEKWEHIAVDSNKALPCLQSLEIHDCGSLQGDLPPFPPSLKSLKINGCRELSVSVSLPNLPLLEDLEVYDCESLEVLSSTTEDVMQGVSKEGNTPTELVHLHLTKLSIENCPGLISLPEHLLLPALKHLKIRECEYVKSLPSEMHKYTSLLSLYIYKCPKLQCFPGGGLPENLKTLHIFEDIKGVQHWGLHRLHSLQQLDLFLEDVETGEDLNFCLPSSSLREVKIEEFHNLKNLRIVDGTNLKDLVILNCEKLESLEVAKFTCPSSTLKLRSCPKLKSLPPLFPTFIWTLELSDLGSCTDAIEQIPGLDLGLPSSLRKLRIRDFQNLNTITCSSLPNLWCLNIEYCPKFESFGDTALPSHLTDVYIYKCKLIKPHLQSDPYNGVKNMYGCKSSFSTTYDVMKGVSKEGNTDDAINLSEYLLDQSAVKADMNMTTSLEICSSTQNEAVEGLDIQTETDKALIDAIAWDLFCSKVGDLIDSPEIKPIAQVISKECYGSTAIISAVGSALREESSVEEWKLALWKLQFGDTASTNSLCFLRRHIKLWFDRLQDYDVKICFLYTALFQEGKEIDNPTLVEWFISEGLLGGTAAAAYQKGNDIVELLNDASLFEADSIIGLKVKRNNVASDTALEILSSDIEGYRVFARLREASQLHNIHKYLTRVGAHLKETPSEEEWEQAIIIFLIDNELSSLPSKPNCSNLVALLLQSNSCLRTIPASFFDTMPSLKILNLSKTRIKSLPDSFSKLKSLQILLLRDCERLLELPPSIGLLKSLKVLDLQGTELAHLPDSVGELASLKQLRVSFNGSMNRSDYKNMPAELVSDGIISRLRLSELGLFVYPGDPRWTLKVPSITEEIGNLKLLSVLYFHFPNAEDLKYFVLSSQTWKVNYLTTFNIVVGHDFKRIVSLVSNDAELLFDKSQQCLRFVNGENTPDAVVEVLTRTASFCLDHHLSISYLSEFGIHALDGVRICILRDCPKLIGLVDTNEQGKTILAALEYLSISSLWNLEKIWVGHAAVRSLARLRFLSVHGCPKLRYVFTCSMLEILSNLEELVIEECVLLRYVVVKDEDAKEPLYADAENEADMKVVSSDSIIEIDEQEECEFPVLRSLTVLTLHYLPELCGIWRGHWPAPLEYISFYYCPKLKNLHMKDDDGELIKEIAADKAWWDSLEFSNPNVSERLSKSVTEIQIDD